MNNWKKVKLGSILTESKIEAVESNADSRIRVLLNANGVIKRPLTKETKGATKYFKRTVGQFIYGKQNLHKGAFGIVPKELDGFTSSSDLPAFDVDDSCLPEWLDYFLKQGDFYLSLIDIAKGAATKRIQPKALFEVEIPLPNTTQEQQEIIEGFKNKERYNELLNSEIQTQKQLVSQLKQSILQEAIQGKLTQKWREKNPNTEPANELLKRVKAEKGQLIKDKKIRKEKPLPPIEEDEIPFDIPDGWMWCKLGDINNSFLGGSAFKSTRFLKKTDIQVIRISNVKNDKLDLVKNAVFIDALNAEENSRNELYPNDIIITMTGTRSKRDYCHTVILRDEDFTDKRLFLNQRVGCFRLNYLVNSNFLCKVLKSKYLLEPVFQSSTGSANQANISKNALLNILIPLPPLSEQKAIVKKVETLMQKCNDLEQEITQSEQHANMLMQAVLKEAFESKTEEETKVVQLPILGELEEKHFVKRKMLASYIINQSANDVQFGDTKFEKLLHLTDYHILKRNLGQEYKQKAAGPYDNKFTYAFFSQTIKAGWFYKQPLGNMNRILQGKNNSKSQSTYDYFSNEELSKIDGLISTFKNTDYQKPEIISTLYAVWNNRLIRNQEITDELLKQDFLNWDKGKAQYVYPKDRVTPAIEWMNKNEFIPDGWGKLIEPPKRKNKKK